MKKSDHTRRKIIEQVAPLFNKKGVIGTSLSDMEKATGLTKGSIYGNFKDKQAVAEAAFEYNFLWWTQQMWDQVNQENNAPQKLSKMIQFYRENFNQLVQIGGCPIINTAAEADHTNPALLDKTIAAVQQWKMKVIAILWQGIQAGAINPLINQEVWVDQFLGLIQGGVALSMATDNPQCLFNNLSLAEKLIQNQLIE